MRVTYHQVLGRHVLDRDNHHLGRVVDLVARPVEDGTLRITGLLIGKRALIRRIGHARWNLRPLLVDWDQVDWSQVADPGRARIRLRVCGADIQRSEP